MPYGQLAQHSVSTEKHFSIDPTLAGSHSLLQLLCKLALHPCRPADQTVSTIQLRANHFLTGPGKSPRRNALEANPLPCDNARHAFMVNSFSFGRVWMGHAHCIPGTVVRWLDWACVGLRRWRLLVVASARQFARHILRILTRRCAVLSLSRSPQRLTIPFCL